MTLELNFEMLLFNVDGDVPERDKKIVPVFKFELVDFLQYGADTQMMA